MTESTKDLNRRLYLPKDYTPASLGKAGKPWDETDQSLLIKLFYKGADMTMMCSKLERTPAASSVASRQ